MSIARVRGWLDETLWGPETAARLVVVHVGLSAVIGARVVLGSYRQLADTPAALVDPVPLLGWLDRMPSAGVFIAIQVVGGLAALAAVLRRHPRLAFAVAWACYLVLAGLRGSRGKVLHNDLLLLWASAPFLLAPTAVDVRDRIARRACGWPVRVATVRPRCGVPPHHHVVRPRTRLLGVGHHGLAPLRRLARPGRARPPVAAGSGRRRGGGVR
jgi:hypothetical protein